MNIFLKTCKKCGRGFDIGINFDMCPVCRLKQSEKTNTQNESERRLEEE